MKTKNKKIVLVQFLSAIFIAGIFVTFFVANIKIVKAAATCACYENILSVGVDTTAASKEECRFICVNREAKNYRFDGVAGVAKCPATFIPNADFTKCECPTGKQVLAGTTYCGDPALAAENSIIAGTPNDPAWSEPRTGIYGTTDTQSKKFEYKLLEAFPGFFKAGAKMTDLPGMILAIYKFGIWTVGIAGLFMLVIGGFMYMASAGNTSTAGSARGIIWDALLGIVAALGAYLILYVINPDLTKINLNFTTVAVEVVDAMPSGGAMLVEGRLTDAIARQNLSSVGISVNKKNCPTPQATNCTSLDGIPAITITNLISLKNACKQFNSNCSFVVTGGTEAGHKSHGPGNPMIDIREDSATASFLKDVKTKKQYTNYGIGQVCTVSQQDLNGISYNHAYDKTCQDPSAIAHFHFTFN